MRCTLRLSVRFHYPVSTSERVVLTALLDLICRDEVGVIFNALILSATDIVLSPESKTREAASGRYVRDAK